MLNKLIPKRMYNRAFLFMTVVSSVVIVLFSLILLNQISSKAFQEIDHFTKIRVNQINVNTEFVLQNLKFYGLRMYEDPTIKSWLTSEEESIPLQIAVGATLTDYLTSQPFIYTAYLINTRLGQVYDNSTWQSSIEQFHDQEILHKIEFEKPKYLTFQEHRLKEKSYLSLIIPTSPKNRKNDGYLVLLLNKEVIQKYLLLLDNEYQSEVFIMNQSNQVILGNVNQDILNNIVSKIANQESGRLELNFNQQDWSIRFEDMKTEGWRIYHVTPLHIWKQSIYHMEGLIIGLSIVLLILLLLLHYWSSRRNFKPFSDLAQKIKNSMGTEQKMLTSIKEVDVIDQGFVSLLDKVNHLNHSIKDNRHILKEEYLRQLVFTGKMIRPVEHFLLQENHLTSMEYLRLVVMRIEGYASFTETYNFASRKLLKYAMGNISQEILTKQGWICEVVDFGTDHIVLLLPTSPSTNSGTLEGILTEIKVHILRWIQLSITVAVSESYRADEKLPEIYERIYELSTLQYVSGEEHVYFEYHLSNYSEWMQNRIDVELLNELVQSIRSRNEDKMKQVLGTIMSQIKGLTYEECKHHFNNVIYSIMKAFKRPESLMGVKGIRHYLERFSNLKEASECLEAELCAIIESLRERTNNGRKEEIAAEIIDFVTKNLHNSNLSIDDVADHVSLSKNYVRQIFKDYYNGSLSEYIVAHRIEHVKALLKTTDWAITDIGEKAGFQTKSNFFTTFKKMTGMTPNQYRVEHS